MTVPSVFLDSWWSWVRDLGKISESIQDGLDKFLPYWIVYLVAVLIGFVASFLVFVLPTQLFLGVLGERKIIGRIQSRFGPNRVGPFGVLQPLADAVKLMQKESLMPKAADRLIMNIAPIIFVAPCVLLFAVIPFGPNMVVADVPASLIYFMGVSSLPVIGTFLSGWSSNNKYSLFGAMRIVAMTISYEIPLVMALLGVVMFTGTLNLNEMVGWQKDNHIWLVVLQPLAFVIYFICASAELNRTPTDIAEAESEIVAGYLTEYSGMKWGLFYGMDIGYALAASAFASTVFLGGYTFGFLDEWVPPWLIFGLKTQAFYLLFIWTRGTLPRLRIDQLMTFAWKFMLPVAIANIVLVAVERMIWTEVFDREYAAGYLFAIINLIAAGAIIVAWARLMGYGKTPIPTRPRLVSQSTGYVPVSRGAGGGR